MNDSDRCGLLSTPKWMHGLLATCLLGTLPAHAAFVDRTVFHIAAGGSAGQKADAYEDFNDVIPGENGALWVTPSGPFSLSQTGDGGNLITQNNAQTIDGSVLLQANIDNTGGENDTLTFHFDAPIVALGFDIDPNPFTLGHTVLFTTSTPSEMGSYVLPAEDTPEFRGFIFSIPITTFTIDAADDNNFASHGIDNVEVYFESVPEPAALSAALSVALLLRRRRQA